MQNFFKKKVLPYFVGGEWRHYALSSYLFPFLKVSSLTFVIQTMTFQAKLHSYIVCYHYLEKDFEAYHISLYMIFYVF